ncbi:hypothetical protein PQU94_15050 [Asticcacaulis sp. DXS10W]|uniref:Uncharacterized protein n=1 Tax=Asticcacaulis currens TaxID=2984210 RepID=A0ABT5II74_9CAUL|nr:hypothetical protein [Asticcacaulis currens]MDC7695593.1 hypothetical protein [Asticcacaulis currens]
MSALEQKLAQKGWTERVKVIARPHIVVSDVAGIKFDSKDYEFLVEGVHKALFGEKGRMVFCAHNSQTCSLKFGKSKASCLNTEPSKCRDEKPELILLFYMSPEKFRIGGRLGRFALPIRCPAGLFRKSVGLSQFVVDQIETIEGSSVWADLRRKDIANRVLLPLYNFQHGARARLFNSIETFAGFSEVVQSLSEVIRKKGKAFIDDRDLEFKADHHHRFPSSECQKVDWLNAHYRLGAPFDERHHYDVTEPDGAAINGKTFLNSLSGKWSAYSVSHLNIFPNDEVQI